MEIYPAKKNYVNQEKRKWGSKQEKFGIYPAGKKSNRRQEEQQKKEEQQKQEKKQEQEKHHPKRQILTIPFLVISGKGV